MVMNVGDYVITLYVEQNIDSDNTAWHLCTIAHFDENTEIGHRSVYIHHLSFDTALRELHKVQVIDEIMKLQNNTKIYFKTVTQLKIYHGKVN